MLMAGAFSCSSQKTKKQQPKTPLLAILSVLFSFLEPLCNLRTVESEAKPMWGILTGQIAFQAINLDEDSSKAFCKASGCGQTLLIVKATKKLISPTMVLWMHGEPD
jgi:hypothetical protein